MLSFAQILKVMNLKRVVFKVGSSVLTETTSIAKERMLNLVSLIVEVQKNVKLFL